MNRGTFKILLTLMIILCMAGCSTSKKEEKVDENKSRAPASVGESRRHHVTPLVLGGLKKGHPFVPNEVIIQFISGANEKDFTRVHGLIKGKKKEDISKGNNKEAIHLVSFPGTAAMENIINKISTDYSVDFVEPNWIVKHQETSNDPYFTNGSLWGMYGDNTTPNNTNGSRAAKAWVSNSDCSDVVVGIIDEGYMYSHSDLAANAYKNPGEVENNLIDDDQNGYVDDIYGWNFVKNNNLVFDPAGDSHGTHVAGTIGAIGGNNLGVAGICWSVKILSGKFLGKSGGTTANAIKAIDYFTNLKLDGMNLVATNNSWGGGGYSQGLYDAISRARNADVLFIAAAGNDGRNNDTTPSYPPSYNLENIISVAALTSTGGLASFSNYGVNSVDLAAPGASIWSTVPKSVKGKLTASYANYNGTSMATPHVTGAAAFYKAKNPGSNYLDIKAAILDSVILTPTLSGKILSGGRLNIESF